MRRLAVPALLLAMTIGVFWRLVLTDQYSFLDSPDLAYQVAPWLQVQAHAWQHGNFPLLWDPYIGGGQSLIGQAQPATAFPLSWLLFLMPMRGGFIQQSILHWYMTLIHYFAALACYALCRDLKRSRIASILGASAYAFGGYVASTWWPQQMQAAIFAPLALMYTLRVIRGEAVWRNAFFSGFFLGMMWLQGHHQVPIFTVLGIAGLWVFHIAKGKTTQVRVERVALFAALGIAMVAAGALQIFPAYSYGHDSVRWAGASHELGWKDVIPYSVHETYSESALAILGPFMNGFFRHMNPFVGFTVCLLAVMGAFLVWESLEVRLLAFLTLGGLIFSLGGSTILHSIAYSLIPMVEKARMPAVAIIVFQLGVCPLAAFGLDWILEHRQSRSLKIAAIASGVCALLMIVLAVHIEVDQSKIPWQLYSLPVTALAAALGAVLLAMLGTKELRHAGVWFLALVLLEIGNFNGLGMKNRDNGWEFWPALSRDRPVAQYLRAQPGLFRVEVKNDDVPYSFGDWYGIETWLGYTASLMVPFKELVGETSAKQLLGVRYYIAKAPASPDQHEVLTTPDGIKLFEVPGAMPRAWTVHKATVIKPNDLAAALHTMDRPNETIVPRAAPPLETCSEDRVTVTKHKAQFTSIDAQMNCRGMVILGDAYSKDWVATIDGKPAPVYAAYMFIRGVVVDRGEHHIEFLYRPQSVYWGALLTFGSFVAALVLGLRKPAS